MGRKYSRIKSAAQLATELTAYNTWLNTPKTAKTGTPKAAQKKKILFVKPFNLVIAATQEIEVFGNDAAWTKYEAAFANNTTAALASGNSTIALKHFRAARVNIVTPGTERSYKASHITKAQYIFTGKTSQSIPFGQATGTATTEGVAFNTIAANDVFTGEKVYLLQEQFRVF